MGLVGGAWSYQNLQAQKRGLRAGTQIPEEGHSLVSLGERPHKGWQSGLRPPGRKNCPVDAGTSKESKMMVFLEVLEETEN